MVASSASPVSRRARPSPPWGGDARLSLDSRLARAADSPREEPWKWLGRAKRCRVSGDRHAVGAGERGRLVLHALPTIPANYRNVATVAQVQVLTRASAGNAPQVVSAREVLFEEWQAENVDLSYGPVSRAGAYLLSVMVENGHVDGSPFRLTVRPGRAVAAKSEISTGDGRVPGIGPVATSVAGKRATFSVHTRDRFGNACDVGGDRVAVRFDVRSETLSDSSAADPPRVDCAVLDGGDGTYTVRYCATRAGAFEATVTIDGAVVGGKCVVCAVSSAKTAPSACTVTGPGLRAGDPPAPKPWRLGRAEPDDAAGLRAGESGRLVISARDEFGNLREQGGEAFAVALVLQGEAGAGRVDALGRGAPARSRGWATALVEDGAIACRVDDEGTGRYIASVVPERAGTYEVHVNYTATGEPVGHSPFAVVVLPGMVAPERTTARGPALEGCVAGEANALFVIPLDVIGNRQRAENHLSRLEIDVTDDRGTRDPAAKVLARADDDRIACQIVPARAGPAMLHVALDGRPIQNAPFPLTVHPGLPRAGASSVSGAQWMVSVGEENDWLVEARDRFGNPCHRGGASVALALTPVRGSGAQPIRGIVVDRGDGWYSLRWTAREAGTFTASITMDGEEVPGAPSAVTVEPGAESATTTALEEGTLLPGESLTAGEWVSVLIEARDGEGNRLLRGGAVFEAECSGAREPALLDDWDDGRYELRFCPRDLGSQSLRVSLPNGGGDIVGSPFRFLVAPGPVSAKHSTAHGPGLSGPGASDGLGHFVILARDALGNRRLAGGDPFTVSVSPRTHGHYGHVHSFEDGDDGSYAVEYTVPVTGKYYVEVTVKGAHIEGSPFPITFRVGAPPESPRSPLSPRRAHSLGGRPWPETPFPAGGRAPGPAPGPLKDQLYGAHSDDEELVREQPRRSLRHSGR